MLTEEFRERMDIQNKIVALNKAIDYNNLICKTSDQLIDFDILYPLKLPFKLKVSGLTLKGA